MSSKDLQRYSLTPEEIEALLEIRTGKRRAKQDSKWKYAISMTMILLICAVWIAMAEFLQAVQSGSDSYSKPYFMSYLVHSTYVLFLMICSIWYLYYRCRYAPDTFHQNHFTDITTLNTTRDDISTPLNILTSFSKPALFSKFKLAIQMNPVMIACVYTWYLSLPKTTVAFNTGIYNSSSVFVYFFSCILIKESITIWKVASVLVSMAGVGIMTYTQSVSGNDDGHNTIYGFVMVIISTILYALYEVLTKKMGTFQPYQPSPLDLSGLATNDETPQQQPSYQGPPSSPSALNAFNTLLFLGLTGMVTLLMYWPVIVVLHFSGIEKFELPDTSTFLILLLSSFLDCIFNSLLLFAIALTSPLFVSVGSLLTIPFSIVADKIFHNLNYPALAFVGSGLIVIGFLGLNYAEYRESKQKKHITVLDT